MENIRETKLIFAPNIARKLLKCGCSIVDIKANKEDQNKTVFVFKNDEHFQQSLSSILQDKETRHTAKKAN